MNTAKKFVFILILFTGFAGYSFGETYFGICFGFNRLSEEFINENYGRTMNGSIAVFSFHHFSGESPWGFYARVSTGQFLSGMEAKDDERPVRIDASSSWDARICFAPSYKLDLGPRVRVPFSIGPVLSLYCEENYNYWYSSLSNNDTYYESYNIGLLGDSAVIINPFKYFFIKSGISIGWDFFRAEKGEMYMQYRNTRNARFNNAGYMALGASLYFGAGIMLE